MKKGSGVFFERAAAKKTPDPFFTALIVALCFLLASCGKKGPPLPPLVKMPVAPADLTASRRANMVEVRFTVPNANTDNTRPANVSRVDVYAFTGPATVSDAEVLKQGTRVASVAVKAPRDPDATFDPADPDQSEADVDPPEGEGLDQGAVARVQETLTALPPTTGDGGAASPVRTYVGVGITTRGRQGPSSRRAAVPLVPPPPAPSMLEATYTETAVTVKWPAAFADAPAAKAASAEAPAAKAASAEASTPKAGLAEAPAPKAGVEASAARKIGYNVYEVAGTSQTPLTRTPIAEPQYVDTRMNWGAMRCYGVRSVETVNGLAVESEASDPVCITLADTFAPAAPKGLQAVASEGVINLIWDANIEPDLDGYYLLRGPAPGDELVPITTEVIRETAFQDPVPSGMRYVYALQAVDRSGNLSPISARTEETAR